MNNFPSDISIAVIDLLQEMTDVDTLNDSEEGATALIDALVSFFLIYSLLNCVCCKSCNNNNPPIKPYKTVFQVPGALKKSIQCRQIIINLKKVTCKNQTKPLQCQ